MKRFWENIDQKTKPAIVSVEVEDRYVWYDPKGYRRIRLHVIPIVILAIAAGVIPYAAGLRQYTDGFVFCAGFAVLVGLIPILCLRGRLVTYASVFVRAEGDSMLGAGIRSGDLLVVDRSLEPDNGSVVIACVDGEFTVKTLRKGRGGVRLEAANPAYPPIRFADGMELRVFGVVTAVIHRMRPPPAPDGGADAGGRRA